MGRNTTMIRSNYSGTRRHAILEVQLDGAHEHEPLDIAADLDERLDALAVGDGRDVLHDDRPGVELVRQ